MVRRTSHSHQMVKDDTADYDDDDVATGTHLEVEDTPPSSDVLNCRAQEYFNVTQQIKDLGAQVTVLRKKLKDVEKSLLSGMVLNNLEEIEINGVKISRTRRLIMKDD